MRTDDDDDDLIPDGHAIHVPLLFSDHSLDGIDRSRTTVVRDAPAPASVGHRPGFLVRDDDSARAADQAYDAKRQRLSDAWRTSSSDDKPQRPAAPATLADAQRTAHAAYAAKRKRLSEGWRRP